MPAAGSVYPIVSPQYKLFDYLDGPEFCSPKPPKVAVYHVDTQSKIARIALEIILNILSVIFFPYGIYRLIHLLGGLALIPAQLNGPLTKLFKFEDMNRAEFVTKFKEKIKLHNKEADLIAKRISLCVNGKQIDAFILGNHQTLHNKNWTLCSNGNTYSYERALTSIYHAENLLKMIDGLKTNLLLYNYPGVKGSQACATRNGVVNAHKAMLRFLEDPDRGLGAEKIILFGASIGGGIQGHAMKTHKIIPDIKYVHVKYDSFSRLSSVPNPLIGSLIKFFGWELSSVSSSIKMEEEGIPEVILQTASQLKQVRAKHITDDGIIKSKGSLAHYLLEKKEKWQYKKIIGRTGVHCGGLSDLEALQLSKSIGIALGDLSSKGFHLV